ncbi:T9SS type A sorting domain-containing protein [bacterium]|nr:T9SS type A sorting domain-containing protein [bacterium]
MMMRKDSIQKGRCTLLVCWVLFSAPAMVVWAQGVHGAAANASPQVTILRSVNDLPEVRLYYVIECDGVRQFDIDVSQLSVTEDGLSRTILEHCCPDTTVDCPMSVAIVADAGGEISSVAGEFKEGLHAFIRDLHAGEDASVFYYSQAPMLGQGRTSDTTLLHAAINSIPGNVQRAFYDAVYAAVEEVAANGSGGCKSVIAFAGGPDNASQLHYRDDVIELAKLHNVHVYVVAIGSAFNTNDMLLLASNTGGLHESLSPAGVTSLPGILATFAGHTRRAFEECRLVIDAGCADGKSHKLFITCDEICGSSRSWYYSYGVGLDSSSLTTLPMHLGEYDVTGNSEFIVQLQLDSPILGGRFEAFDFSLVYDRARLTLTELFAPQGSMLEGVNLQYFGRPYGTEVHINNPARFNGADLLAFRFETLITPYDTVSTEVRIEEASFRKGCLRPVIQPAEVRIRTGTASVICDAAAPDALTWQVSSQHYAPDPFVATLNVQNIGDGGATGMRFHIDYDTADVMLVSPAADVIPVDDVLFPSNRDGASWQLSARPRTSNDTIVLRMTAEFDNAAPVTCTRRIHVPASARTMYCGLDVPTLIPDTALRRYDPMPLPVTLTVHNPAGDTLRNVRARLVLPSQLNLAAPDAPDGYEKDVLPPHIPPLRSGVQTWMLEHPLTPTKLQYIVGVWVYAGNGDSTFCQTLVTIPAIAAPILKATCSVPQSITFDTGHGEYMPNPFSVSLTCKNEGSRNAVGVYGELILPPDFILENQFQPLKERFSPSTVILPQEERSLYWAVRYTGNATIPEYPVFAFRVYAVGGADLALDTMELSRVLRIVPELPSWACGLEMPDTLHLDSSGTGIEPNPFTLRFAVGNTGTLSAALHRVRLTLPLQEGISLHPSSPMGLDDSVNVVIGSASTARFEWLINVQHSSRTRDLSLRATAWDDLGGQIECVQPLHIDPVPHQLACSDLRTPGMLCGKEGETFSVRASLRNSGGVNVNTPTALLEWSDKDDIALLSQPGNENPQSRSVIFPGQEMEFTWQFELLRGNTGPTPVSIPFTLRYSGEGIPVSSGGHACADSLRILSRMHAPVQIVGNPVACVGDTVLLDAGDGYAHYAWNTGDTLRWLYVTESGTYFVQRMTPGIPSCPVSSDTVDVLFHPLPAQPVIARHGDTLVAPDASSWQWLLNGQIIPMATSREYLVMVDGEYSVRIGNEFGCSALSDVFTVILTGTSPPQPGELSLQVFPNPFNANCTVQIRGGTARVLQLTITDLLGREVLNRDIFSDGKRTSVLLDLSAHPPGIYLLHLAGVPEGYTQRLFHIGGE